MAISGFLNGLSRFLTYLLPRRRHARQELSQQPQSLLHTLALAQFYASDPADEMTAPMLDVAGVTTSVMFTTDDSGTTRVIIAIGLDEVQQWLVRADDTVPLTVEIHGDPVFVG